MPEPKTKTKNPPCGWDGCANESTGVVYMHTGVTGWFLYLCPDCLEDDHENVFQEPCTHCHGSGDTWEGWECEYCQGSGTTDY